MKRTRSKLDQGQKTRSQTVNTTLFEYPPLEAAAREPNRNLIIYTKHDHKQLHSPHFLNDTIISFFMQYHLDQKVEPALKDKIHIFNSFFFAKIKSIRLSKNGSMPSYSHASRWLRNVKIFDKDFLIMPVCEQDHWLLVIVCYPSRVPHNKNHSISDEELYEPAVIVLNSCKGIAPPLKKALSQFLRYQWNMERGNEARQSFSINNAKKNGIRLLFPDLPQQKNNYDCGVYILGYFYSFLNDPRTAYLKMFRRRNMTSWFKENDIDISRERRKMQSVIKRQIERWTSTHKQSRLTINGGQGHKLDSQEIHISSPSQSESSGEHMIDNETDLNGNDHSVIVIN